MSRNQVLIVAMLIGFVIGSIMYQGAQISSVKKKLDTLISMQTEPRP